jgi:16S rRNA (cytosine1402-N4)-methyltransferase
VHKSVLVNEVMEFLKPQQGQVILDATVGGGGHAEIILKSITPGGRLIGIDCDERALKAAQERLDNFKGNFELACDNFRNLDKVLDRLNIKGIDGALFDLGVSSLQLDDDARGFSFKTRARLDMRMDENLKTSAYDVVNKVSEIELDEIIKEFGEERYHKRIARAMVEYRKRQPITDTTELARIIYEATPARYRRFKIDPATRTFQAIRIAVNDELGCLKEALEKIKDYLNAGARLVVIAFHSLEDRIVKHKFREMAKDNICVNLTKKPVVAKESEILENPRARSAKLRAVEKNV